MNIESTEQPKMKLNSNSQIKDTKLSNYKGYFFNKNDEADSHNHEFGSHFKYKDLVRRLEKVQKEQKRKLEIEECK